MVGSNVEGICVLLKFVGMILFCLVYSDDMVILEICD